MHARPDSARCPQRQPATGRATLLLLPGLLLAASASATTYRVDTLLDDSDQTPGDNVCDTPAGGPPRCTLRAAIEEANAHAGPDRIEFDLGQVVFPVTEGPLPTITDHLVIDGRTAPLYDAAATSVLDAPPSVYINGLNLGGTSADGFRIDANGARIVEIHAIGIINFPDNGIELVDGTVAILDGNWIGVTRSGAIGGNGGDGIRLAGCDRCVVGQEIDGSPARVVGIGNLVSNNAGAGIYTLLGDGNVIAGNHVGVDPLGNADFGNGAVGIHLVGPASIVGDFRGTATGFLLTPNIVRNNGSDGIRTETGGHRLNGNTVNGNQGHGIAVNGSASAIGGVDPQSGNFVGENGGHGIVVGAQFASSSNVVRNNRIGANGGRGVQVASGSGNTVSANEVFLNANDAVRVDSADNEVSGNHLGFLASLVLGNAANGVVVAANDVRVIGNRIAGMDDDGIDLFSGFGIQVTGNQVGSSHTGLDWGNANAGIRVRAAAPNALLQGNTVGFNDNGMIVEATDTLVCNNRIGVGLGDQLAGNTTEGLWLLGDGNVVGSEDGSCAGNVIGDNGSDGIEVWGADNIIASNRIGGVPGLPLGNDRGGIVLHGAGATGNLLVGNVLWYNGSDGVRLTASAGTGNALEGNSFGSNGGQGIDLLDDGPTPNDAGDADAGPNRLMNAPVITSAIGSGGELAVTFHVDAGAAAASYPLQVEFYLSGPGILQGSQSLSLQSYGTPGASVTRFIALPAGVDEGGILATASDALGNTSEFSAAVPFFAAPLPEALFKNGFED